MYNICMENIHCLNNACVLLFNKLNTEPRNLSLGSLDTAEFDSADPPSANSEDTYTWHKSKSNNWLGLLELFESSLKLI